MAYLFLCLFVCGCLSSLCILEMNSLLLDWQRFCVSHLLHSVDSFAVQTVIYHSSFCLSVLLFPETSAQSFFPVGCSGIVLKAGVSGSEAGGLHV